MGSLRERPVGSGRWELRVYAGSDGVKDVYVSRTVRGSERDARKALARLEVDVEDRRAPRPGQGTVEDLLEEWWTRKSWVSARSRNEARGNLDRYLLPELGAIALPRLTHEVIDRLYDGLLAGTKARRGLPLARGTVRRIHADLHSALAYGVKKGRLGQNPAARATPPVPPPSGVRAPEPSEIQRLIAEARPPEFALFVELAAATGRRREDLLGLQFRDLHFDEGEIAFARRAVTDGSKVVIEELDKNRRSVRVSVDEEVMELLEVHLTMMKGRALVAGRRLTNRAFVFSDKIDACVPWRPDSTSRRFRVLAARCGVKSTLHGLRHAHCTELLSSGVDIETVAGRVGDDPRTILKTYSHFRPARDKAAARTWRQVMGERPKGEVLPLR